MHIVSVNVGLPRSLEWRGRTVSTGIFKQPVEGPVAIRRLNLDGDRQADLSVHGGPDKAVYAYPVEHFTYWREELPDMPLTWGQFGENLTISGLREGDVQIGDRYRVGTAELVVTQPRLPCYKLGIRFGRPDMVRRFLHSERTGFYFAVLQAGAVQAGDSIALVRRARHGVTVADITRLYTQDDADHYLLEQVVQIEALPISWREYFRERLARSAEEVPS
jgi:MOSC domain-containing protein YiiM